MDQYAQGRRTRQVRRVRRCRRQLLEDQDLCFSKLLPQEQVEAALERHRWNRAAAALELGISRTTLWRRLHEFNLMPVIPPKRP